MVSEYKEELLVEGEYESPEDDGYIDEYDLTATPNDFNVMTINNFIESGAIQIPGFQRHYVWDIKKASKLIESLLLGLPVPQLFLYESARNKFLVIDGQQRMMSIFYFIKKRFPKKEKRAEIRKIFAEHEGIPEAILEDDNYFQPFKLSLSKGSDQRKSKFHGLNYGTLDDYKTQLDLRPIRNIVVKQNSPKDDDSSIYEIFNRLNSGGVNLKPQEIRGCLYHSEFYSMLSRLNYNQLWRATLKMENLDVHMKDVELILRSFAMAYEYKDYKPSLANFLNNFSKKAKVFKKDDCAYLEKLFISFLEYISAASPDLFVSEKSRRFNIFLFEAVFACLATTKIQKRDLFNGQIEQERLRDILSDKEFQEACVAGTTNTTNVFARLDVAARLLVA
jgi:uncharacterized protein with ParB-like and HNH nuclease domain